MAETAVQVIVSPFLEVMFGNINTLIKKEFGLVWGVNKDLEKLSSTLSAIQCVLKDAEDMQIRETVARDWLRKLKDAAFHAENILDECQVEALRFESDIDHRTCSEQVSHSFSTCYNFSAILFRRKMGKEIKLLAEKFQEIADQRKFHLNPAIVESGVEQHGPNRETSSTPTEPIIYGRDEERDLIVQMLLNNVSSQNNLSISPILGLGGLGKTTLAQLVYNDQRVVNQFDAKIWICVSEDFGIKRIAKMVLDHLSGNASALVDLDAIQNQTRKLLRGKKFLLVLDDVWDDSQEHWNQMIMYLLSCGDKGSSVIVTTRLPTVINSMTRNEITAMLIIYPTLNLQALSQHDCWSLFKHYAFGPGGEENPNLVKLGKEIIRKCWGVPLAVKALGGLLHLQNETFWRTVSEYEIWNLQKHGDHEILPVLRLSYNHLPPVMRQCFAFCAVYPKNYIFEKDDLINQWIANGFIQSNDEMEVEDIGDIIFDKLLRRSFFQNIKDNKLNIMRCNIHDLMHDVACSVMVDECLKISSDDIKDVSGRIRHMFVTHESQFSQSTLQKLFRSQPFLHTLIFSSFPRNATLDSLYSSFSKLKFLKVLTLSPYDNFKRLPLWIGHLKHLRYLSLLGTGITSLPESICSLRNLQILNLSQNHGLEKVTPSIRKLINLRCLDLSFTGIKELPETICNLTNLQFLNLSFCYKLKHLPKKIGNMKSLRYLYKATRPNSLALIEMPVGIGELSCLETILPIHLVRTGDNRNECGGIQELERLNCLKGMLSIDGLENVDDPKDAQRANLKIKTNLSNMVLNWTWDSNSVTTLEERSQFDVLRALQPHCYLQELIMDGYKGKLLPNWMGDFAGSLPKLTSLKLCSMPNVAGWLPSESESTESGQVEEASHNHLILPPSLKKLGIHGCPNLKIQALPSSIEELEIGRSNDPTLSWMNNLPHLSALAITGFHDGLPEASFQNLAHLDSLYFLHCSKLKLSKMFQTLPGKLRKLRLYDCRIEDEDAEIEYQLGALKKLAIRFCESLKYLYWWQYLTSLQTLGLHNCPNLDISAVGFQHLGNLRFLQLFKLPQLSSLPDGIQHLTRLEKLEIERCKNLTMIPEWMQQDNLLPSLHLIGIIECHPELHKRCTRDKGDDWHKISHLHVLNIPN